MIIARAPYRISFFGGGTDFPIWYNDHPGAVLATSIDKYCYIIVRKLPPFFEHKHRIVWSQIELPSEIVDIKHPAVRETLKYLNITDGVEIHHAGDLPAMTGMGTSSSFTVALLKALQTLKGNITTKKDLVKQAIHIEQDLVKETVGSQDQTTAAYGGFNRIDFTKEGISVTPVNPGKLQDYLMLFFTGFQRQAQKIEQAKLANITTLSDKFNTLYQMVGQGVTLLGEGDYLSFGGLLNDAWNVKRSMAPQTSTDYIDFLYDRALKAGAIGGKLLGAGGGGFLLIVAEPDRQPQVRLALKSLLQVPFKFENEGCSIIFKNGDI